MDQQIGEEIHRLIGERRDRGVAGREDGGVAERTPDRLKSALPLAIDGAPPGVSIDGVGGARKRMKNENFSIALIASTAVVASVSVTLFGWAA